MKYQLREGRFHGENKQVAKQILHWIEDQDSKETVRGVFYAMVSAGVIENVYDQYRRVSKIVKNLREYGMLDWSLIVDESRRGYKTQSFDSAHDCTHYALDIFRLDRWKLQSKYVQIWVEKRGLVSVLFETTNQLDVTIVENGGRRLLNDRVVNPLLEKQLQGKQIIILYVGDYDPSGLRMDENMVDQLRSWGVYPSWERVAITREQIDEYDITRVYTIMVASSEVWLPKHPDAEVLEHRNGKPMINKLEKDPSAQWFRDRNNGKLFQVEVDALPRPMLQSLVHDAIIRHLDPVLYKVMVDEENQDRDQIRSLLE